MQKPENELNYYTQQYYIELFSLFSIKQEQNTMCNQHYKALTLTTAADTQSFVCVGRFLMSQT